MNRVYRIVWNETTHKWVIASELAKGYKKKAKSTVGFAAAVTLGFAATGDVAFAQANGNGSLELCPGSGQDTRIGSAMGYNGSNVRGMNCDVGISGDAAFSLNNNGSGNGDSGFAGSTVRVTGYQDGTLELKGEKGISFLNATTFNANANFNGNKITSLANGVLDTDAVNVSQLKPVVNALGGGASVNASTGAITGPTYTLANGGAQTTVGGALAGLDGALTTANNNIQTNATQLGDLTIQIKRATIGVVQQSQGGANLTVGKDTDGAAVDFTATAGERKLVGVADGELSASSHDAVTGSQLFATNENVTSNTLNINKLDSRITVNEGDINDLIIGHVGLVQQADANAPVTIAAQNGGAAVNVAGVAGSRQLKGVAAGTADDDAVNLQQLNKLSDQVGTIDAAAVKYDNTNNSSVTLSGIGATDPVALRNVADGELSTTSHDAVNGGQLYATNKNVTTNTENIDKLDGRTSVNESHIDDLMIGHAGLVQQADTNARVTVAAASGGTVVDFSGTEGARQLTGVAAGTRDIDAVNLGQLKDVAGDVSDLNALAVKYDDPSKTSITLGGLGTASPVALHNIADGELSDGSLDAVNGSQLYATNHQVERNTGHINDLLIGHAGLVQQADAGATVTMAASSGGTLVTVNGIDGNRQIRGVAAGTQDDDAVNLSQLKDLAGQVGDIDSLAVKYDDAGHSSIMLGGAGMSAPVAIHNVANGVSTYDAVNFGQLTDFQNDLQLKIGGLDNRVTVLENEDRTPPYLDGAGGGGTNNKADAGDTPGVAVGYNSVATGDNASAVGHNAQALGAYGFAGGNDSYAAGDYDTAIGGNAKVNADNSVAVGANSAVAAGASNAAAIGANSSVNAASGTAVGQGATVTSSGANSVALGAGSVADRTNTVSVGAEGAERQITNVAAGTRATDAVNVGQLQNLQDWTSGKIDDLHQLVNRNQRQANRGIASSAALVNNMPYVPGKVALSAGVASYRGESALGVAVSRWSMNGRVNINAGISAARGDSPIFRVGLGVVLGD